MPYPLSHMPPENIAEAPGSLVGQHSAEIATTPSCSIIIMVDKDNKESNTKATMKLTQLIMVF